jgi:tetratricopeptide (TPR) repeat protein
MTSEERRRFGPPPEPGTGDEDAVSQEVVASWSEPPVSPVIAEETDDEDEPRVSWFAAMLGRKRPERLAALDRAIAAAPDAPINYVLRGELRLKLGQRDEAATDFQKALGLAERAFAESDWGLVAQAISDRALVGLRRSGYAVRGD